MKIRSLLLAAFAVVSFGVPASAADMPMKAPAYAVPAINWTGPYIGAFAGYHFGEVRQSGCVGVCSGGEDLNLGLFGFQVGYDWQMPNNMVWGVFAAVPVIPADDTVPGNPGNIPFDVEAKFQAMIGARLGFAMGNALPYIFAGPGVVRVKLEGPVGDDTNTHLFAGFGAGVEYRLTRNWSVDLRYMYSVVFKETYNIGGGPSDIGDNAHNLFAAINYRF